MLLLPWKLMFFFILFLGSLIAMSASSWLMAWMGLEMNMLALLAILMSNKSARNSEATLKYFLIQALASAILISSAFSASAIFSFLSSLSFFSNFILLSLITKIGGAPFHGWIPQIIEGLTWNNNLIVLTWQKVAPFVLISSCLEMKFSSLIMSMTILMSAAIGAIMGLSQTSLRKIIAFSSINHIGWMVASLTSSVMVWVVYFSIYCSMLIVLVKMISKFNLNFISSTSFSQTEKNLATFYISLMSFGGLPPFLGFAPKWYVISQLATSSVSIIFILVMTSLLTLFFYSRLAFSAFLLKSPSMQKTNLKGSSSLLSLSLMLNMAGLIITPLIFMI